jgi:hypothetical protein
MKKLMQKMLLFGFMPLVFPAGQAAYAYDDSAGFNPVPVTVKAQGAGFPVGMVVAWPASTNPEGAENWLDCNGQAVSAATYPELYAIVGGAVPDYRGVFLRGVGGQSDALGVTQTDTAYFGEGTTIKLGGRLKPVSYSIGMGASEYVFSVGYYWNNVEAGQEGAVFYTGSQTSEIPVEITNGATETRPVNKAVRFVIRAKP